MNKIKRVLMLGVCHSLYGCGHVWSRAVLRFDCMAWTYFVYNNLMLKSYDISEKYKFGMWANATDEIDDK